MREVLETPRHPYSERLLAGFSHVGGERTLGQPIPGSPPHPGEHFPGCRFAPRCHRVFAECEKAPIPLFTDGGGREARCLLARDAVTGDALFEARGLKITYQRGRGPLVRAVDGVDLDVAPRRDARARRRVGLRQVDARADAGRPRDAERRARIEFDGQPVDRDLASAASPRPADLPGSRTSR